MEELKQTVIIKDNPLNDELRKKCKDTIERVSRIQFPERYSCFEEIHCLIDAVQKNKNESFNIINDAIKKTSLSYRIEILQILDVESDSFIKQLQDLIFEKK